MVWFVLLLIVLRVNRLRMVPLSVSERWVCGLVRRCRGRRVRILCRRAMRLRSRVWNIVTCRRAWRLRRCLIGRVYGRFPTLICSRVMRFVLTLWMASSISLRIVGLILR